MRQKFDPSRLPAEPTLEYELELWNAGRLRVAGIDEAGRGPLAGPVAAGAVIFSPDPGISFQLKGVRDSKQMTAEQREHWAEVIKQAALTWGVGFASSDEIDSQGLTLAVRLAVRRALLSLALSPQHLLADYMSPIDYPAPQTFLVKGDARSLSIAAASVLAKTSRDGLMCEMDALYPGYGFARHKGYGTPAHLEALRRLGPCPIHRRSFRSVISDQRSVI